MDVAEVSKAVWAKSYPMGAATPEAWLPLTRHLDDTAAVAQKLWDEWLPPAVRRIIAASFSGDDAEGRRLATFLAAVHDIGKASPAFAVQVPLLADRMRAAGLAMSASIPNDERRNLRHELAGQVILESWLTESNEWDKDGARQLGIVVGGHHGVPPTNEQLHAAPMKTRRYLLGDGLWADVQRHLVERAAQQLEVVEQLNRWQLIKLPQSVQVLLTGIVIVADWIASNDELFPLARIGDERPAFDHRARTERAWAELRLPGPWRPTSSTDSAAHVFRERFDLPDGTDLRPIQAVAFETATTMDLPGIMVIEAPMGEGKTEAALLAAEILAARTGASGCFVALPTQATTDAMFLRVLDWLARLPDASLSEKAANEERSARTVTLAHGKATLNATFNELRMAGRSRNIAADEPEDRRRWRERPDVIAHSWISGRKKGPLADFVVGTIDQVLFASLRARHLALRHLGLAGKVVIIDEAHAYDSYMNSYLERALDWLGAYGAPVVLLSATLPAATRRTLLDAYARGASSGQVIDDQPRARRMPSWMAPQDDPPAVSVEKTAYPAITILRESVLETLAVEASGRAATVLLETADDDIGTLAALLDDALADGGCALVVRNTVRRARDTAAALRDRFGADVEVAHSRFIGHDRIAKDTSLLNRFGRPGADGHSPNRPKRAIVVATQVVEQSLDVDFDLMVTDLAPIDLVLQRIGRMHRHVRGAGERRRPERLRKPRCVIVGVDDWAGGPPEPTRGSTRVYRTHSLYRAAALVDEIARAGNVIRLPDDIAPLVERAYSDVELGQADWEPVMARAREEFEAFVARQRSDANTFRLDPPSNPGEPIVGWLQAHVGEADESQGQAQVRDSQDNLEVLLLLCFGDQLRVPDWVDRYGGWLMPLNGNPSNDLARAMLGCAIRLPAYVSRGADGDRLIAALEKNWFPQLQSHPLLAGQLILALDDDCRGTYGKWTFHYDARDGLEVSSDD